MTYPQLPGAPTEPGPYWYIDPSGEGEIVHVWRHYSRGLVCDGGHITTSDFVTNNNGTWYGPIPPPTPAGKEPGEGVRRKALRLHCFLHSHAETGECCACDVFEVEGRCNMAWLDAITNGQFASEFISDLMDGGAKLDDVCTVDVVARHDHPECGGQWAEIINVFPGGTTAPVTETKPGEVGEYGDLPEAMYACDGCAGACAARGLRWSVSRQRWYCHSCWDDDTHGEPGCSLADALKKEGRP